MTLGPCPSAGVRTQATPSGHRGQWPAANALSAFAPAPRSPENVACTPPPGRVCTPAELGSASLTTGSLPEIVGHHRANGHHVL